MRSLGGRLLAQSCIRAPALACLVVAAGVATAPIACSSDPAEPDAGGGVVTAEAGADVSPPTACRSELASRGARFSAVVKELDRPAGRPDLACAVEDPILLEPVLNGVTFRPDTVGGAPEALFTSCPLALAIERMTRSLAARKVTDLVHFGIYGCRVIAGTDQLSEHGLARALDIAAVRLEGGAVYSVLTDWVIAQPAPPSPADQFLHELVKSLFDDGIFNIILTPDFNADHRNHFHCDLTPGAKLLK